jgi:methyl-accepting chemotaxis protein
MSAIDSYLGSRVDEMRAMTTSQLQVTSITPTERAKVLIDYAGAFGSDRYADLTILDLDGKVIASTGAPQIDAAAAYLRTFRSAVRPGILPLTHFSDQSLDVFPVYAPMFDGNGQHTGTLLGRLQTTEIVGLLRTVPVDSSSALYLLSGSTVIGQNAGKTAPPMTSSSAMRATVGSATAGLGLSLVGTVDQKAALAPIRSLALESVVAGVIVLALAFLAAFWTARRIAAPIERVREAAHRLADGSLDAAVAQDALGETRELRELGASFNRMASTLRTMIGGIGSASHAIAKTAGDNVRTAESLRAGTEEQELASRQILAALSELAASARSIRSDCIDLESSSRTGLTQLDALVAEVDSTNVALHQLTESIDRSNDAGRALAEQSLAVATRARDVGSRADSAKSSADRGGEAVGTLVADMHSVGSSLLDTVGRLEHLAETTASAIRAQVTVINDMAERSSLLALNAGIEAARAGSAGRGFAVIASELQRLAAGSKSAGDEVADLVESVVSETQALVKTANGARELAKGAIDRAAFTSESIDRLVVEISENANGAREIVAIASNQAERTAQIELATEEMRRMAQATQNAAQVVGQLSRQVRGAIDFATSVASQVATATGEQTQTLAIIERSAVEIERTNALVSSAAGSSFATSDSLQREIAALAASVGEYAKVEAFTAAEDLSFTPPALSVNGRSLSPV